MIQGNTSLADWKVTWRTELEGIYSMREADLLLQRIAEDFSITKRGSYENVLVLTGHQLRMLQEALIRLKRNEPWQYIAGKADFCGMQLIVNNSVLIPRPETEELIEWIYEDWNMPEPDLIFDFGTGSGCIALALKKKYIKSEVVAWDISPEALNTAKSNAQLQKLDVSFHLQDILSDDPDLKGSVLMVSNPPYIHKNEWSSLDERVKAYEPGLALFVQDDDVIIHYKALVNSMLKAKADRVVFYAEISNLYVGQLEEYLHTVDGIEYRIRRDLSGLYRFLKVTRK